MKVNCAIIDKRDTRSHMKYDEFENLASSKLLYGLGRKGGAKLPFRDEIHQIIHCFKLVLEYSDDEARRVMSGSPFELLMFGGQFTPTQYELLCSPFTVARFVLDEALVTKLSDLQFKHMRIDDAKGVLGSEEQVLLDLIHDDVTEGDEWVGRFKHRQSLNWNLAMQLDEVVYELAKPLERRFNNGWR